MENMGGRLQRSNSFQNNNNYAQGGTQYNRPFERFRPGSISQAMDILLDKQ